MGILPLDIQSNPPTAGARIMQPKRDRSYRSRQSISPCAPPSLIVQCANTESWTLYLPNLAGQGSCKLPRHPYRAANLTYPQRLAILSDWSYSDSAGERSQFSGSRFVRRSAGLPSSFSLLSVDSLRRSDLVTLLRTGRCYSTPSADPRAVTPALQSSHRLESP